VAQLHAVWMLWEDAQRREQEAITQAEEQTRQSREQAQVRERKLLDQVSRLQCEMDEAEGKIEGLEAQFQQPTRHKPPDWWIRLFGRG
jgi:polyhydroxyalkanoate synthesis regulator phasin